MPGWQRSVACRPRTVSARISMKSRHLKPATRSLDASATKRIANLFARKRIAVSIFSRFRQSFCGAVRRLGACPRVDVFRVAVCFGADRLAQIREKRKHTVLESVLHLWLPAPAPQEQKRFLKPFHVPEGSQRGPRLRGASSWTARTTPPPSPYPTGQGRIGCLRGYQGRGCASAAPLPAGPDST